MHNQPERWSCLAGILRAADLAAATITDDLATLAPPNLARFDVILDASTDLSARPDQIVALVGAVAGGTGFVGLHAATVTFRESAD